MSDNEEDLNLNERRLNFLQTHYASIEPFSKQDLINSVNDPNMETYF